jgi:hypothetical protein
MRPQPLRDMLGKIHPHCAEFPFVFQARLRMRGKARESGDLGV